MNFKMAKQTKPTTDQAKKYDKLCSIAYSRISGNPIDVKLDYFKIPTHITKSYVFGGNTNVVESGSDSGTVNVPSKAIVKEYIAGGVKRTSEEEDITQEEFRREKAILEMNIHTNLNASQGEVIKIYPELYSRDVPECNGDMIIIREYIPGENLEEITRRQLEEDGEIMWEKSGTKPAVSESLYPIALLHVQSPIIAPRLKEKGLLEFGEPKETNPVVIADDRANRFVRYVEILARGLGKEVKDTDAELLKEAMFELDRKHVSREDLLTIVDGELDVFPHHAMLRRLTDAGAVEVGGFVRDLALYGAPAFNSLWEKKGGYERMAPEVLSVYLGIKEQLEKNLRYENGKFDVDSLVLSPTLAAVFGNTRKSGAVVHYNGRLSGYPVEDEATAYLSNAMKYADAFIKLAGRKSEDSTRMRVIKDFWKKYKLNSKSYKLVDSPKTPEKKVEKEVIAQSQ